METAIENVPSPPPNMSASLLLKFYGVKIPAARRGILAITLSAERAGESAYQALSF